MSYFNQETHETPEQTADSLHGKAEKQTDPPTTTNGTKRGKKPNGADPGATTDAILAITQFYRMGIGPDGHPTLTICADRPPIREFVK